MRATKLEILLLSAYDADSHHYWHTNLVKNLAQFNWTVLALPPRYFSWRIRGNPLSWVYQYPKVFSRRYDAVVATSMVDLATLKGLVPALAHIPSLVYFHENQFGYPKSAEQHSSIEAQMVNLYSALAANRIVFNSVYNLNSFLAGIEQLLRKLPDQVPSDIAQRLREIALVLPVPLDRQAFIDDKATTKPKKLTLVWNHRWEYDKAPERFYSALNLVKAQGIAFNLRILGKSFRDCPTIFQQIKHEFGKHLLNFGRIDSRQDYLQALRSSHSVISTAIHDFQGLSVLEAVAAGCVPVAPNRLAYPEFLPEAYLYDSHIDNPELEAQALSEQIIEAAMRHKTGTLPPAPNLNHLSWNRLKTDYQHLLENLLTQTFKLGTH